jgi:hypothetical protein
MKKSNPFATEVELRVASRVTLPKGWVAVMRANDQPARTIVGLGEEATVVEGAGYLGRR